jgi:hypothetical protein
MKQCVRFSAVIATVVVVAALVWPNDAMGQRQLGQDSAIRLDAVAMAVLPRSVTQTPQGIRADKRGVLGDGLPQLARVSKRDIASSSSSGAMRGTATDRVFIVDSVRHFRASASGAGTVTLKTIAAILDVRFGAIDPDSMARFRDELGRLIQQDVKAPGGLMLMYQVFDAWSAKTRNGVHSRLAALPIRVRDTPLSGSATRRDYYVSGRLKLSLFLRLAPQGGAPRPLNEAPTDEFGGASVDDAASTAVSRVDYCEGTDPLTNVFYSGDCATQQDLDDLAATIALCDEAVDEAFDDVASENFDIDGDAADYCAEVPEDELCLVVPHGAPALALGLDHAVGQPGEGVLIGDRFALHVDVSRTRANCGTEAIVAAASAFLYYEARVIIAEYIFAPVTATVPPVALGVAAGGTLMATAGAAVYFIGSFLSCKRWLEPLYY